MQDTFQTCRGPVLSGASGLLAIVGMACGLDAQSHVFKLAGPLDSVSAPSAGPVPGLRSGFREQILISGSRLQALVGKRITGISFRRDLATVEALTGGVIGLTVRLSVASGSPDQAVSAFAANASSASQTTVFVGDVTVPNSPAVVASVKPWDASNAFTIRFSTPFAYAGSTLCVDITGRNRVAGLPDFWYVDHEYIPSGGSARRFGSTCSVFNAGGVAITAEKNGYVLGGMFRTTLYGQPGAQPLLLLGASSIPGGLDLSLIGATGCRQHVDYFAMVGMRYHPLMTDSDVAFVDFIAQVPFDQSLLGAKLFVQGGGVPALTASAKVDEPSWPDND